jgi:hypothetical protein
VSGQLHAIVIFSLLRQLHVSTVQETGWLQGWSRHYQEEDKSLAPDHNRTPTPWSSSLVTIPTKLPRLHKIFRHSQNAEGIFRLFNNGMLFSKMSRLVLQLSPPPTQWGVSPGVKWQEHEADHSPLSTADSMSGGAIPPLPYMSLRHGAQLIKPRDNFSHTWQTHFSKDFSH